MSKSIMGVSPAKYTIAEDDIVLLLPAMQGLLPHTIIYTISLAHTNTHYLLYLKDKVS